ncbi:hypothetical protein DICVIV_00486 [Dictyocaulus viviparus]|uniref:Uncharacterized protein n=1 Tax=Dictyocaulus viviparus TaxID=29172 RepID=A0A0D8Y951_DICVI|nr:hypothetical protein DICVIV_00486 [Dictyocaulus viviparus]
MPKHIIKVFISLKDEFTHENVCEPTSSPKYMTVVSTFASIAAARGDIYGNLNKCYTIWRDKIEPNVRNSTKKHTYAELPLRLAACFLLNGDYYKALSCLLHSINLESKNILPRVLALRWSAFLGEWEMAEMALAFENAKFMQKDVEDYFASHLILTKEFVKYYVDFNRDHNTRSNSGTSLLKMTHKINADTRTTFLTFEAQSFANWIYSFNCLHRAVVKSEGVMKNRIPGIHKESESIDFRKLSSDVNDFLKACASYAEFCELRREYSIELLNVGMVHDAAFHSQLGLWSALKIGVFFRIQQFVNVNTLIRQCVVQVEFRKDLQFCMNIIRILYLKEPSSKNVFGGSKQKEVLPDDSEMSLLLTAKSPMGNRLFPASEGQKSVAISIMESFEDLRLE